MPPGSAFRPPRTFGNYDVHEPLGRGGMATVFRGEHRLLQRPVAIKFLHSNIASRPRERQRFLREARLVAKLAHPNIVAVFDFGELEDGTYYQASELVAGTTLRDVLRGGALPFDRALRFARQIALGLASAHAIAIVHRDLKPSNVMVAPDPAAPDGLRLKILDFGIAKSVDVETSDHDGLTKTGIVIGTPGYMAPEQCVGSTDIGPAADIYSLGVVLYAMLCGRRPFDGEAQDLLEQHVVAAPPRPSDLAPGCTPEIDALVARCLAKAPRDRPEMADVIAAIDAALGLPGEPLPAAPPPRPSTNAPIFEGGGHTVRLASEAPLVRLAFSPAAGEATESHEPTTTLDRAIVSTTSEPAPRRRSAGRLIAVAAGAFVVAGLIVFAATRGGSGEETPHTPTAAPTPPREEPVPPPKPVEAIAIDHEPTSVRSIVPAPVPAPVVVRPVPKPPPPPRKQPPDKPGFERANY